MTTTPKNALVFFALTDFDRNPQREQHLAERFAECYDVLYLEAPFSLARLHHARWEEFRKIKEWWGGYRIRETGSGFRVVLWTPPPSFFPLDKVPWINRVYHRILVRQLRSVMSDCIPSCQLPILYMTQPRTEPVIGKLPAKAIVIDWCNPWVEHWAHLVLRGCMWRPLLRWYYDQKRRMAVRFAEQATVLIVNALVYLRTAKDWGLNAVLVPSGVVLGESWARNHSEVDEEPQDLAPIPHPRIGVIAARIDKRIVDLELIKRVAALRPMWNWVLLGHPSANSRRELAQFENVFLLGHKAYGSLPRYIASFALCTVPYLKSTVTQSGIPVKLMEYFALGKPVVTYPADEIQSFEEFSRLVYFAATPDEFIRSAEGALHESPDLVSQRTALARQFDWDEVAAKIHNIIETRVASSRQHRCEGT